MKFDVGLIIFAMSTQVWFVKKIQYIVVRVYALDEI